MKISIVISSRNEFPNIVHTCHSIWNSLESDGFKPEDSEIILVDNNSDDSDPVRTATNGTSDFLICRGAFANRRLKVLYDPIAGNVTARNKGAEIAKGEYLFFSDSHMSYGPGTFKRLMQTIDECGGIVHPAVAWMGSYPPSKGMGYSLKAGETGIKGTWNNLIVGKGDDWFYVPGMGHCCLGMKRELFQKMKGYPTHLRCYGGGELYGSALSYLLGYCTVTEPRVNVYHLSAGRGYSYQNADYIHNVFLSCLILGADDWAERGYLNNLRKGNPETLNKLWKQAEAECQEQKEFVKKNKIMTFNEMLERRPWDEMNMKKHGTTNSGLLVFHPTWIEECKTAPEYMKEAYRNSKHQKELEKFIVDKLWNFVYHNNKYDKGNLPKI